MPATFRSSLATNRIPSLLIAFPSIRLPAIECTGHDRMEEIQARIETLEQFSEEYENLSLLFAEAQPLSIDGEGRVILSERLKEHADIAGDVAFVGLGAMFQLWNPGRYAEHSAAVRERARRQGTTLPPRASPGAARPPS